MTEMVVQMTKEEFREMIEVIIEQKLLEMFGEPDEGLEIRETVRERLQSQKEAVAAGERGKAFEDVIQELGLG
jgi:DNA primase large subunit